MMGSGREVEDYNKIAVRHQGVQLVSPRMSDRMRGGRMRYLVGSPGLFD
jgi:hypothetical protein